MEIKILHLIEGAKKADGLTVIIDVFRAASLECYLYSRGAEMIIPVGSVEEAWKIKKAHPEYLLVGERGGAKCEGFDYGNSPSAITEEIVKGKTVIHTTSAGTQGIINATGADEIIMASLTNAKAVASYIKKQNPQKVSIVCMGNAGVSIALEDELCAEYIRSLLEDNELTDIEEKAEALKNDGGAHFFNPDTQEVYPEPDFWLCVKCNIFPFLVRISKENGHYCSNKVIISGL